MPGNYFDDAWAHVGPALHAAMATISAVVSGGTVPARDALLTIVAVSLIAPVVIKLVWSALKSLRRPEPQGGSPAHRQRRPGSPDPHP